jgi:hypothetical protein
MPIESVDVPLRPVFYTAVARDARLYKVACLLGVLKSNTSDLKLYSDLELYSVEAVSSCCHVCSVCQVEQMTTRSQAIRKTTSRCCRDRYHAILGIRRMHICTSHYREYRGNCELFMHAWPILSFWIAQNYEAALIAMARRAVDALPARDGLSSNDSEMPDLAPSSSSSSRDEVPFVLDEESSDNESSDNEFHVLMLANRM